MATAPAASDFGRFSCGPPVVHLLSGFPAVIDRLAEQGQPSHRFLRRAWFDRPTAQRSQTLFIESPSRVPLAALPLVAAHGSIPAGRAMAGCYWPFRSFPASPDLTVDHLVAVLGERRVQQSIGPLLRIGPVLSDDRQANLMRDAAGRLGWQVLERRLGVSFRQPLAEQFATGAFPGPSLKRKMRTAERRIQEIGTPDVRIVRGREWSPAVLRQLADIEAASWVGSSTDHSGAKFLKPESLACWNRVIGDRHLADRLCATILTIDGRPVAFSFDLICGPMLYAVASSYDQAFARISPGALVTVHALNHAVTLGVETVDWGCGDTGYKTEWGAQPGPAIVDLLFVRSPVLAAALRPAWEVPGEPPQRAMTTGLSNMLSEMGLPGAGRVLVPGIAMAVAAMMLSE
ncbi:GNAT family N-acetyltransferase [Sphingomonas sp. CJ99]